MTWKPAKPYEGRPKEARSVAPPVSVAIVAGTDPGSNMLFLSILVRPDRLPDGLSWWRVGQDVAVIVGEDEHAGQLRVAPGGPFKITRQGSKLQDKAPSGTRVPLRELAAGVEHVRRPQEPAAHQVSDGVLLLTLPAWARPEAQRQKAA